MSVFTSQSEYYNRVFEWVLDVRRLHASDYEGPLFLAINGPQGSGKTTLTSALVKRAEAMSIGMLAISIDDFYLTRSQQQNMSENQSHNRFLQARGYPGTHDITLGLKTLRDLQESETEIKIPRYDKSAFEGKGDRLEESKWEVVNPKDLEVILIEGWMLGFKPMLKSDLAVQLELLKENHPEVAFSDEDERSIQEINHFLKAYAPWNQYIDGFIRMKIEDFSLVTKWRMEAEANMKASGKPGMSEADVKAYADMFQPAYHIFTKTLSYWDEEAEYYLELNLDENRMSEEF